MKTPFRPSIVRFAFGFVDPVLGIALVSISLLGAAELFLGLAGFNL